MKKKVYSTNENFSRGRYFLEKEDDSRGVFQRDRDRIIHCAAFRRLEHKTQVFVHHEGDHYRSRLTHTIEVSQIARSLSRTLNLDEDLSEAIALAHDLGHTPFGHAGEEALNLAMIKYGGFSHNAQTIRIITFLEKKYMNFDGLNLSWETLEGIIKHNGPINKDNIPILKNIYINDDINLDLNSWCGPEAQVASLADDIAYCNHDMDDGIRAELFSLEDICSKVSFVNNIFEENKKFKNITPNKVIVHETIRKMISRMIGDVVSETQKNIDILKPNSAEEIRSYKKPLVSFSPEMIDYLAELRLFLTKKMYKHSSVNRMTSKAKRIVADLFDLFYNEPECLPTEWRYKVNAKATTKDKARVVSDYIAGMTDRFAIYEHKRLFDLSDSW